MQYSYRHDERLSFNIILYARKGKEYLYMEIMDVFCKPVSSCTLPLAELTLPDVKDWIMKYVTTIPAISAIISVSYTHLYHYPNLLIQKDTK